MFLHEYLPFFYVILKHIITTGIALLNITILLIIVVVICQQIIITVKLSFIITFNTLSAKDGDLRLSASNTLSAKDGDFRLTVVQN